MRALVAALLFCGAARAEEVAGIVFETTTGTRVPSEGAYVIVHWIGHRPGFGHYESVCLQAAIGRTDSAGRFVIPEPPMRSRFVLFHSDPAIAVYKPGFDAARVVRPRESREWSLVPTQMSREQRATLADVLGNYGCREDDGTLAPLVDPQGVLADFKRAIAAEKPKPNTDVEIRILPRSGPNPASR